MSGELKPERDWLLVGTPFLSLSEKRRYVGMIALMNRTPEQRKAHAAKMAAKRNALRRTKRDG
jgi:hypothetical protein